MHKYNIGICLIALITMLYLETYPLIAIVTSIIIYIVKKTDKTLRTQEYKLNLVSH